MEEEKALALNSVAPSPLNRSNSSPFPSRMGRDSSASLAPGFRFHPTDEELVRYYLKRKVTGKSFRFDPIAVIDIYKSEPWDLPYQSKLKSRDLEWYFFSALDKKYVNGSKTNRATEKGYWKTTGKDRPVRNSTRIVGMKKTLVYHSGRAPRGARTNWVMHEYRLTDEELEKAGIAQNAIVLCRIFEKSGTGPKNGEQYGAPFVEEEWEDDEVVMVPLPGDEAVTDEVANGDCAFVETNDPDQYLDMGVASESDGLPLNFYNGECSSYPGHSEEFTEDQKPIVGTVETFEPQNDQLLNMPEQYAVDSKPMTDGINGEASHSENPLNFNYAFDASYLDATDNLLVGEGSFLETNDLLNPVEANSVGTVAADVDMPDEYLTYFDADDDITQYITFDSPEYTGSENAVSDQGPPLTQQNVDEEAKEVPMESKNDLQPLPSEEASSSKQHPEESKLVSGKTYPFMKQASHFLGSIPAPPAFASEFPSKEMALRLHSGQSSNSAHVTAGMIRITDFTIGGNEMNWMMGKNGEFNVALSPSFSQTDVNSAAALVPVSGLISGKFAFMVSHGWIFLISFSVVILSLSFKIGCLMYTGKSK